MTPDWTTNLVEARDLTISFGATAVVDTVSLDLPKGRITALVGESGSGKSLIAHSIAGILTPAATLQAARFGFSGVDLSDASGSGWRDLRGRQIAIIFQNPRAALSPVRRIGQQIGDVIARHRGLKGAELSRAVVEALASVGIVDPEARQHAYTGELSGGMCQRVMIALALACNPRLLIADEPTTGLDNTTQAAILDLVVEQIRARHMACLLITHDLALAREYADEIRVMHAGQIVEEAESSRLFSAPRHPYTRALLGASASQAGSIEALEPIPGSLPDLRGDLPACRFADRCARAEPRCRIAKPLTTGPSGARVACWNPVS
ncbi:ABC transporter ATP-binding protein [Sinirhodobacter sp. WL0062]|uniref:ABC transporter ATP-binding protein n=1 Tax=Rhodobacter flavimaris TaxID=2907145 RepID=A0ABS8YX84_9RHOB|nr:ABC transporter ATP-binding protein [Sinirhodobacter sp. WL0062]MCE5973099.1 ABC transporter ATP-binding protein [Sinirhodobacter sp. WL0062]